MATVWLSLLAYVGVKGLHRPDRPNPISRITSNPSRQLCTLAGIFNEQDADAEENHMSSNAR